MSFRKSSDFSYKDSIDVVSVDLSHVGPITRRKFKNSGLDGSEYFTSLKMVKNNNSHMMVVIATPGVALPFEFLDLEKTLTDCGGIFGVTLDFKE
ncbi:hypothetical protein R3W88_019655 [Solanum pinnatisectum]|uniref:Uncharacterized protein n=1 Tax=Solanum pinnatisectum TaxID=50273 RepID=A0AAV9KKS2_9SOLN|nr:hypothetical protein R3W88_019655 [Solanum pinnatisectum]